LRADHHVKGPGYPAPATSYCLAGTNRNFSEAFAARWTASEREIERRIAQACPGLSEVTVPPERLEAQAGESASLSRARDDGCATLPEPGALAAALSESDRLREYRIASLVIDTETDWLRLGQAQLLAERLVAGYHHITRLPLQGGA
jgi:hypothetical protein